VPAEHAQEAIVHGESDTLEPAEYAAYIDSLIEADPPQENGQVQGIAPPLGPRQGVIKTGGQLAALLAQAPAAVVRLAEAGLTPATRKAHRRLLQMIRGMPTPFRSMPTSTAIIEFLDRERIARGWKQATRLKYMASLTGALGALPLYIRNAEPVLLSRCPVWRSAMLRAAALTRATLPNQPLPATREQVNEAIRLEPHLPIRVLLVLTWAAAARVGDLQKLHVSNLKLPDLENETTSGVVITYTTTKTSKSTGVRTITTGPLSPSHMALVRRWIATRNSWIFPQGPQLQQQAKEALRRVHPRLECRSLRRGALQTMALNGVSAITLQEFSGHTTERSLRIYLGWGSKLSAVVNQTTAAGAALNVSA
jgi:integrase